MPELDAPPSARPSIEDLLTTMGELERRNAEIQAALQKEPPETVIVRKPTPGLYVLLAVIGVSAFGYGFRLGSRFWSGTVDSGGICHQPRILP